MINDPNQLSQARQPRGVVKITAKDANGNEITGEVMPGWIEFDVSNNVFFQADTFRVAFAASALPDNRGVDWWAQQVEIGVELRAGFPANPENFTPDELQLWIYGNADEMNFDPVSRQIDLHGRDLTAALIDTITTENWSNKTATKVAQAIAERHGLEWAKDNFVSTRMVGDYYQIDHVSVADQMSEWDMLNWLAGLEQCVVYVRGRELVFKQQTQAVADPYVLHWQQPDTQRGYHDFNGTRLSFSRDLTVARGIKVEIRSFNQKTGKVVTATYPPKPKRNAQLFLRRIANLTPEKAMQEAQSLHKERSSHEVRMHADIPADDILTTANVILVEGTGTAYDQLYYPDNIVRHLSMEQGYTMTVSAKNHSPENEVR